MDAVRNFQPFQKDWNSLTFLPVKSEGFSVLSAFREVSLLRWIVLVAFITSDNEQ